MNNMKDTLEVKMGIFIQPSINAQYPLNAFCFVTTLNLL